MKKTITSTWRRDYVCRIAVSIYVDACWVVFENLSLPLKRDDSTWESIMDLSNGRGHIRGEMNHFRFDPVGCNLTAAISIRSLCLQLLMFPHHFLNSSHRLQYWSSLFFNMLMSSQIFFFISASPKRLDDAFPNQNRLVWTLARRSM